MEGAGRAAVEGIVAPCLRWSENGRGVVADVVTARLTSVGTEMRETAVICGLEQKEDVDSRYHVCREPQRSSLWSRVGGGGRIDRADVALRP